MAFLWFLIARMNRYFSIEQRKGVEIAESQGHLVSWEAWDVYRLTGGDRETCHSQRWSGSFNLQPTQLYEKWACES